jgi:hypothetical protein
MSCKLELGSICAMIAFNINRQNLLLDVQVDTLEEEEADTTCTDHS